MGNLAAWIASLVPGMVARVMASLGFGILTVTGLNLAWQSVQAEILGNLSGAPGAVAQLAGLAGIGQGIGIILGAITARVAYSVLAHGSKVIGAVSQ